MKNSNHKIYLLLFILGFVLYGNTLFHDFTLDDAIVITENDFTKKGFSGIWDQLSNDQFVGFYGEKKELVSGGRYRPLSMVVFNIQYALGGQNPFLGHLFNVLFYILNACLLFRVSNLFFNSINSINKKLEFPLLVTLLWFFHPIHTEVVANIKGLDEIMAFTGELLCMLLMFSYLDNKKTKTILLFCLVYFLALLSKENAITWMAIFPISVYFFYSKSQKEALPIYAGLLSVSVLWFAIRYQVVGGGISDVADNLMNDPFFESSTAEKYSTIVYTLGKYILLMFFPHPLTYDYYPKHIPIVSWGNSMVMLSLLSYLGLIIFAIWGFFKKNLYAFGVLIFMITLSIASNLLFPIGAFMNERFVFVSSWGFAIVLALLLNKGIPKLFNAVQQKKTAFNVILIALLLLGSIKTISRNLVWKNNLTLATHDAQVSINGAKSNVMAGGLLGEEAAKTSNIAEKNALLDQSIFYLNRAINIYPDYIDALLLMGNSQWERTKSAKNVFPYYLRILSINPNHENTWQNCFIVLEQSNEIDYRIQCYQTLLRINPNKPDLYVNLGRTYGQQKNDLQKAKSIFLDGRKVAPNDINILSNLATVYGLLGEFSNAIEVLELAIKIQPSKSKLYVDLGMSYYYQGDLEKAKMSFDKASQLDPNTDRSQFPI